MKRNTIILAVISFIFSFGCLYFFTAYIYHERLSASLSSAKNSSISVVDIISPEIKAAFLKPDDISLLYSIERMSKIKNVTEAFILDKNSNVVIHNDSSKWNKKYNEPVFSNAVSAKDKKLQSLSPSSFLYSVPINENAVLCAVFSLDDILSSFKIWKIKLYVLSFLFSVIFTFFIYYLLKFFFIRPFEKAKKYLSLNERNKKTIYSDLVNMAFQSSEINNEKLDNIEFKSDKIKELFKYVLERRVDTSASVFSVLDDSAKIVYCSDVNKVIFSKQTINTHIVNATANINIIQEISKIIDNADSSSELNIENLKINIIPVRNEAGSFIGIVITGK